MFCTNKNPRSNAPLSSTHRKRAREYLEPSHDSELCRFVLATQGKEVPERHSFDKGQHSRCVQRTHSNHADRFGLQKRRLVESFEGLNLEQSSQKPAVKQSKKLIQVLNSVEFSDYEASSQADQSVGCSAGLLDSEMACNEPEEINTGDGLTEAKSCDRSHSSDFSQYNSSFNSMLNKSFSSDKEMVKFEIADKDIRDQAYRQFSLQRPSFLDKAESCIGRSRS